MVEMRHRLPSLNALAVFEAAGRLGGFSRAARELRISQPAVTRHIRGLEAAVGHLLFQRAHNRVTLTEPGLRLWQAVNAGFGDIAAVVDSLRVAEEGAVLALSTHSGFGQQWLMPRLEGLREALGGRSISLSIADRSAEFDRTEFDIGVRHGSRADLGPNGVLLAEETVMPVVGWRLAEARPELLALTPDDLVDATLIHMDEGDRPWMTWAQWFRLAGVRRTPPPARVRLNHYPLVMSEVLSGTGIGLGWRPLIDEMLESGVIVPVGPEVVRSDWGWWFVWSDRTAPQDVERALAWFRSRLAHPSAG
ncbi:DNA-binding transcriptional regulator, LysR family [Thalassobaculum litoreum DSM 18839]|uniref:DNA-binding transcriptional regulator, LysR family n=2 Tax=Thalassobaculaceae TaxID=2844864 RepID=A0A8G2F2V2_9PROT|nr:DNA-binding transcriptional regulator, LysR family [Thalassobaculum litoreum DSM 18839]